MIILEARRCAVKWRHLCVWMAAELNTKMGFCSILECAFDDIIICERIQAGVKNTKNHRFWTWFWRHPRIWMDAELTAKFAFCSILEHGFGDIIVYEWIQTGVKNTRNRRFFNVLLTTSLYMNGFKPVSELTARLTFGPTGFHDILVCEWIQTGAENTKNRRFLNVVLTTSL